MIIRDKKRNLMEEIIYRVIYRFFCFVLYIANKYGHGLSFSFFQTQIEKEIHTDKQNYDQVKRKKKIAYLQKIMDIHCERSINKEIFACIDVDDRLDFFLRLLLYTTGWICGIFYFT